MPTIRVLHLADSHLGFDWTARPRVKRRRRGDDFFRNYNTILTEARTRRVDLVVHAGDLYHRSKPSAELIDRALMPLLEVAEAGIPVFVVPGNHERSRIAIPLLAQHPNLKVFSRARCFVIQRHGMSIAVSGFPFVRNVAAQIDAQLEQCSPPQPADIALLCLHQTVESARVAGYTFPRGPDVIPQRAIPSERYAAVLCGHIHRAQTLLSKPSQTPVTYAGSIERTSFAERDDAKSFSVLTIRPDAGCGGRLEACQRVALPARPMVRLTVSSASTGEALEGALRQQLETVPPDAVVSLEWSPKGASRAPLSAKFLRTIAPETMNVDFRVGTMGAGLPGKE